MDPASILNRSYVVIEEEYLCNETARESEVTSVTSLYLLCAFIGCLSVLIMCGNLLVIVAIVYFKQLHSPTNYLILSLAVADVLVGVIVLPFSAILTASSCGYLQNLLCKVRGSIDMFLCTSSILSLCCISVDRYYAVCQPLRYRTIINVRVIVMMILVSWTLAAVNAIGITIRGFNQRQSNMRCVLYQNSSLLILGAVFGFYLPAGVMFTIYLKILMVAEGQARSIKKTTLVGRKSGAVVSKMERKATKTLALVLGLFLMCWTPFFLCITFNPLSDKAIPVPLIETFKWLGWSNSMLNPFIYAFFYKWFRSAFRMIVSGKIFRGNVVNSKLI